MCRMGGPGSPNVGIYGNKDWRCRISAVCWRGGCDGVGDDVGVESTDAECAAREADATVLLLASLDARNRRPALRYWAAARNANCSTASRLNGTSEVSRAGARTVLRRRLAAWADYQKRHARWKNDSYGRVAGRVDAPTPRIPAASFLPTPVVSNARRYASAACCHFCPCSYTRPSS